MGLLSWLAKNWRNRRGLNLVPEPPRDARHTLPMDHPHRYASTLTYGRRSKRKARRKMQYASRRINRIRGK